MVFGKQSTSEAGERASSVSTRSYHLSMNERRPDESTVNQDNSSTVISKLFPIAPDNMSINLAARYDISALNRSSSIVRNSFL